MQIYYYCSYTGSPVGYILGQLTYDASQNGNCALSGEDIPALIRKCFELGTVRKAIGVLPATSRYFLLAKKLTAKGCGGQESSDYYLNIALVTDDAAEFQNWLRKDPGTAQEIADAVKATMELDRSDDFGFTIRPVELASLLKKSFQPLFKGASEHISQPDIFVELAFAQTDLSELQKNLGLSAQEKTFVPLSETGKWVRYSKKKRPTGLPKAALLGLLLLAASGFIMLILRLWK